MMNYFKKNIQLFYHINTKIHLLKAYCAKNLQELFLGLLYAK